MIGVEKPLLLSLLNELLSFFVAFVLSGRMD